MSGKNRLFNVVLSIALFISMFSLPSCGLLPAQVERDLQRQIQTEFDYVLNKAIQQIQAQVLEFVDAYSQKIREYLGIDIPALVGDMEYSTPTYTPKTDINAYFDKAFKKAGGARVLGWPQEKVQLLGSHTSGLLYQYLYQGPNELSVIVMTDQASEAHVVTGEWFSIYKSLGGIDTAGSPISDVEDYDGDFWKFWAKDQRQLFSYEGESYVLMKPGDVEQVMVVPPLFWQEYQKGLNNLSDLGAALTSLPLDEKNAIQRYVSDPNFAKILGTWEKQPVRIQIFERGSLIYNKKTGEFKLYEVQRVIGGEITIVGNVGTYLVKEIKNSDYSNNACFETSIHEAGRVATSEGVGKLLVKFAFMPAEAALQVGSWGATSLAGKLFYGLTDIVIAGIKEENLALSTGEVIAGNALDGLYAKILGDALSGPVADASVYVTVSTYEKLKQVRTSVSLATVDKTVQLTINYDPWTHQVWGVVTSDCQPDGYLYMWEVDKKGIQDPESFHIYDLAKSGAQIR